MTYPVYRPPGWRPKRLPLPEPLPAPVLAGQLDEFAERPFGGGGELLAAPPEPAVTVQVAGLVIEPPPWAGQVAAAPEPEPLWAPTALEVMTAGEFDPRPWGPPETTAPFSPITFPEPNWREGEP